MLFTYLDTVVMAGEGNDFSDFFASTILPYDFCGDKQSHLIKSFDVLSDVYILYCKIDIMQIDRKKRQKTCTCVIKFAFTPDLVMEGPPRAD